MIDVIYLFISTMDLKFLGLHTAFCNRKTGENAVYWKKTKFSAYLGFITSISFGNINTVTKDQSKSKFL